VLAGGEERAAPVVPQGKQLVLLVRALIPPGALERLGQQWVGEHLSGDPLGIQRV
jgi:hypothetical protein